MEEKEIDAHNVTVEELCKRFNTSIEAGLTDKQVSEALKELGPNKLKNPPYVPIWVRVCCFCFCLKEIKKNGLRTPPLYQENPAKKTQVRRNGSKVEISAGDLTLGDIVEVKAGDMIPADIRIIKSDGFKVDQSSLTGESEPDAKSPEKSHDNPLESANLAFFHTRAVEGSCVGIVYNIGSGTVYGRVAPLQSTLEF